MNTFKFVHYGLDNKKVIYSIEAETWPEVVEGFEEFLKACGFNLGGNLEVVPTEE